MESAWLEDYPTRHAGESVTKMLSSCSADATVKADGNEDLGLSAVLREGAIRENPTNSDKGILSRVREGVKPAAHLSLIKSKICKPC